ncbi:MAG: cation-transporting P-type ATPase, partial [Candidatus Acidiferrum sp.]
TEAGLNDEQVVRSRSQFGGNQLAPLPREPLWRKFLAKFDEPIIKILLAAALLSMFVDLFQSVPVTAGIALLIVVAVVVGAIARGLNKWVPAQLFASAVVLFVISLAVRHPSVEGMAVMMAVVLATGVSFASEYKSDREFEALNERKHALTVKDLRGGTVLA